MILSVTRCMVLKWRVEKSACWMTSEKCKCDDLVWWFSTLFRPLYKTCYLYFPSYISPLMMNEDTLTVFLKIFVLHCERSAEKSLLCCWVAHYTYIFSSGFAVSNCSQSCSRCLRALGTCLASLMSCKARPTMRVFSRRKWLSEAALKWVYTLLHVLWFPVQAGTFYVLKLVLVAFHIEFFTETWLF